MFLVKRMKSSSSVIQQYNSSFVPMCPNIFIDVFKQYFKQYGTTKLSSHYNLQYYLGPQIDHLLKYLNQ